MRQLNISEIKVGMRFSRHVYFEDGKNMFIAANCTIRPYHLACLTRWNIPFLLSDGVPLKEGEVAPMRDDYPTPEQIAAVGNVADAEDIESLDEVEEIEEIEDLDDAEPLEDAETVEDAESVEELEDLEEL